MVMLFFFCSGISFLSSVIFNLNLQVSSVVARSTPEILPIFFPLPNFSLSFFLMSFFLLGSCLSPSCPSQTS